MLRESITNFKLANFSLQSESGETLLEPTNFLLPESGIYFLAGDMEKTHQLLRCLSGLSEPASGTIVLNDNRFDDMSFEDFLPYRLNLSYGFDLGGLLSNRSIRDNLKLCAEYHALFTKEELDLKVNKLLTDFDIKEYANERPFHVPGYVRKLVCVLRSFVHEPQYVLLDSPTTALDSERKVCLGKLISNYCKGEQPRVVIFSSSDEFFLEQYLNYETILMVDKKMEYSASANFGDAV